MTETSIEWTDVTWNPTRGCARVSPGCERCYAERQAARFCAPDQPFAGLVSVRSKVSGLRYTDPRGAGDWEEPRWTGGARFVPHKLGEPITWKQPRRVFVDSMSDLFHDDIAFEEIAAVFGVMAACRRHTFQILTKRAPRMCDFFRWLGRSGLPPNVVCEIEAANRIDVDQTSDAWPLPNVWLGVSCEDQERADARIPFLLETPAAARFVSAEPLLNALDFERVQWPGKHKVDVLRGGFWAGDGQPRCLGGGFVNHSDMNTLDWVIVGGESGHGARACYVGWVRSVVAQCKAACVPVFVKQLGKYPAVTPPPYRDGDLFGVLIDIRHKKGGNISEWPDDLRVREFPFEESAP